MTQPARKFEFGLSFTETGDVQRIWNETQVEAERARARETGASEGQAGAERAQAESLRAMASQLSLMLAHLTRLCEELRADAASLALTAARKIAGSAVAKYPHAEIEALADACAAELRAAPRLKVTLPAAQVETLRPLLEGMLANIGFAGALRVTASETMTPGGAALDWDQGGVDSDPARIAARIEALVEQRLKEAPLPQLDLFAARARAALENEP